MKFQKLTRGGFEYRIYAEDCGGSHPIHGAVGHDGDWQITTWKANGSVYKDNFNDCDLIPEKKRRFKTNEELIASGYSEVSFCDRGVITVKEGFGSQAAVWMRFLDLGDSVEEDAIRGWLRVFTVEEV